MKQDALTPAASGDTWTLARRLWRDWVRPYRSTLAITLVFILGVAGSTASYPLVINWAFERFAANDTASLAWIPVLVIFVTALKGATLYGQVSTTNRVASAVVRDMQAAMLDRLVKADLLQLGREAPAALAQRFSTDLTFVQTALNRSITSLIRDVAMILALLGTMLWLDWQLALVSFLLLPVAAWPIAAIGERLRRTARATQQQTGDMASFLTESLAGARMVKTYRLEADVSRRGQSVFESLHTLRVRAANAAGRVEPILEALGGFAVAIILVLIGWRLGTGGSTLGQFTGFVSALLIAAQPMRSLGNVNAVVQEGMAAAQRIFAILDRAPDIQDAPGAVALVAQGGAVTLENVTFRYGTGETALVNVSLHVPAGKTVALVGRSGAGKSTIFNLVPRLADASEGRVLVDGQDVRTLTLSSLRDSIALVSQDVVLFDDTIAANIGFGRAGASRSDIEAAARAAAAHEFIMAQPEGYDTVVGDRGGKLSGGERQRIALARAILRNAPILLLDEATSALDAESESLVQAALDRLSTGRTTLVIAHRLSTVRRADLIVVMDRGQVVEQGTHEALIAGNGAYAALYRLQFTGDAA